MAVLWGVFVEDSVDFGVYSEEVLFRSGLLQQGGRPVLDTFFTV